MPDSLAPRSRLPATAIWLYCLPVVPMGFMFILIGVYLMKHATDVLLMAPATMGMLFGLSRIWDAVSDPLCGYLSDRTRTRLGRRRPWMLAGALPLGAGFFMLWSPPATLEGSSLTLWMGAALILFYTAMTAVDMPHAALGAELSDHYHERTRIFAIKRAVFGIGMLGAVAGVGAFGAADDPQPVARAVAWLGLASALGFVLWPALRLRERAEYQGRGGTRFFSASLDVWRNPHARLLFGVFLIQQLGVVALTGAMPFFSQYVLRTPEYTFAYIGAFLLASVAGIPLWLRLSVGREKKRMLMISMALVALAIALLSIAREGDVAFVLVFSALGGFAGGGADVLGPSIQADVIDWDELRTGQRKEGVYFAAWSFVAKSAGGLASMAIGWSLAAIDYVPNAAQGEGTRLGLRLLTGLFPALLYGVGVLLFSRFALDAAAHDRIRRALDARAAEATRG